MKKTILLLASAALLLVGCAKEKFAEPNDGGLTSVTFSASVDGGVATKVAADNDGKGTNVNRCIMEIYFQDELYTRLVQTVTPAAGEAKAYATFANVPVVAGKEYQILFWADCGGAEKADLYYTTTSLKAVTVAKTAFIGALEASENDKLDAFCSADNYTVPQSGKSYTATLKRPFAQLNVITTDVGANKTVTSAALLPEKVSVSYKAADVINVATGEVSGTETFTYEAPVYGDWSTVSTNHELTLSMDYILASTEQGAVDVTFKTKNGGTIVMNHALTNLPYKRNYRTNVKGDLLTTAGSWTATIDPIWSTPDIVKVVEVADIKSANEIINQYAETTNNLEVKFVGVPNDSGVPTGEQSSQYRAILTSPLKEGANLGIEVMTSTNTLYVGDYKVEYNINELKETEQLNEATVNINVPANSGIQTLIINAPSKTVYVNGQLANNVGEITNIDAITSQNTLIIEPGQTVSTLTMRQGGLEIHGTLGEAIVPEGHGDIAVRDCENLKESEVYNVLAPHIATGYMGVKGRTTAGLWDIVPIVCKIGNTPYGSLADAIAAVENDQTITLTKDIENAAGIAINTGKTFTIDFNNHKYIVNKPGAGSTSTETAAFQLLKGQTITFKNGTIEAAEDNLTAAVAPAKNIKRMFQSYANVTFENMTIDGTNIYGNNSVCEFACGAVDIKGTTSITSGKQGVAVINVDTWKGAYPEGAQVTISSTGEFGDVYLYAEESGDYTKSSLTITDGKFDKVYGDDSGDWTASISGGVFSEKPADEIVAAGYAVLDNPDATTKAQYPWTVDRKHVAMIGRTMYHTLADAVAAAQIGNTIKMIDDFETADKVTVAADKEIVLELNGKTISYTTDGYGAFITNCGHLTITDSSNGKNGKITAYHSNPNWMEGCYTIDNSGQPSNYNKASTLIINSGTIENTSSAGLAWPINNGSWGTQAELIINGGTIHSVNYVPVREYLHYGGKKTIVINGGKFISDNSRAIAVQVNDATIQDAGSSVTINGGEFTCNGSGILYIDLHAANANLTGFTMTVNDGKFLNNNANVPVLVYDDEGNTQTEAKLLSKILKGGIYSKEPAAELISFGYHIETNTDSQTSSAYPYRVVANSAEGAEVSVSKQGQATVYSTLAAFRDETNAGNTFAGYTVTLLKDIDLTNDDWTPIGTTDYYYYFSGVFDGNNHLIILNKSEIPGDFGFFNLLVGDSEDTPAIVENLNLKVNLSSKQSTRTWIGGVTDMAYGYVLFENIVVTGSITSGGYAGGIVGYSSQNDSDWGSKVIYKNCTNKANINIVGKGDYTCLGGIAAQTGSNLDCFINCKNEGILTSDHTNISTAASYMGHMVGKGTYGKNISFSGCSFSESATINGWNVNNSEVSSYPFEGYMTPSQTYTYGTGTPNLGKQMVGGYFGTCTLDGVQQNFTYPNGNSVK